MQWLVLESNNLLTFRPCFSHLSLLPLNQPSTSLLPSGPIYFAMHEKCRRRWLMLQRPIIVPGRVEDSVLRLIACRIHYSIES